jgi:hypothetical protein
MGSGPRDGVCKYSGEDGRAPVSMEHSLLEEESLAEHWTDERKVTHVRIFFVIIHVIILL